MVDGSKATVNIQSIVVKERSPFSTPTYQLTAANLVAWDALWVTLKAAIVGICAGTVRDEDVLIYDTLLDSGMPITNYARRELKLIIRYTGDTTGDLFKAEFPCPKMSVLIMESGDANFVQLADAGLMATFVTAWEALARSPKDELETVTVQSAQVVGRNI